MLPTKLHASWGSHTHTLSRTQFLEILYSLLTWTFTFLLVLLLAFPSYLSSLPWLRQNCTPRRLGTRPAFFSFKIIFLSRLAPQIFIRENIAEEFGDVDTSTSTCDAGFISSTSSGWASILVFFFFLCLHTFLSTLLGSILYCSSLSFCGALVLGLHFFTRHMIAMNSVFLGIWIHELTGGNRICFV